MTFHSFAENNALRNLPITFKEENLYFLENGFKKITEITNLLLAPYIVLDVESTGPNFYSEDLPTRIYATKGNDILDIGLKFNIDKNEFNLIEIENALHSLVKFTDNGKIPVIVHYSDYSVSLLKNLTALVSNKDFNKVNILFYDVVHISKIILGTLNHPTFGISLDFLYKDIFLGADNISKADGGVKAVQYILDKVIQLCKYQEVNKFSENGKKQDISIKNILKDKSKIGTVTKPYVELLNALYKEYDLKQTEYERLYKIYVPYLFSLNVEELNKITKDTGVAIRHKNNSKIAKLLASYDGRSAFVYINETKIIARNTGEDDEIIGNDNSEKINPSEVSKLFEAYKDMIVVRNRMTQLISFFKQLYKNTKYTRYGSGDCLLTIKEEPVKRVIQRIPDFKVLEAIKDISDKDLYTEIKGGISFGYPIV